MSFRIRSDARMIADETEYILGNDSVAYVPARLNYRRKASYDELIVVHFDSTNYNTKNIEYFYAKEPRRFEALFRKMLALWEEKSPGYKYSCSAVLNEKFALCYAEIYDKRFEKTKIQRSVDYSQSRTGQSSGGFPRSGTSMRMPPCIADSCATRPGILYLATS